MSCDEKGLTPVGAVGHLLAVAEPKLRAAILASDDFLGLPADRLRLEAPYTAVSFHLMPNAIMREDGGGCWKGIAARVLHVRKEIGACRCE